ncbi:hypothetical protein DFH11DRAFT_1802856 [Phellopilus nigrolimitatus]|nr:hypothetical protein DFH11DRAFT_1802856 [Phellopilus nigrolimitatus]
MICPRQISVSVDMISLPSELLIEIFVLATYSPVRDLGALISASPFESAYSHGASTQCEEALRTKYSLALACSFFRRLSLSILYECIWIRHGSDGLLEALEKSKNSSHSGLGTLVKCVSLSEVSSEPVGSMYDSISRNTRRILLCCPNTQVLIRPQEKFVERMPEDHAPPVDDLQFSLLSRIDWHDVLVDHPFAASPSPRFIRHSNSLHILKIGVNTFISFLRGQDSKTVVDLPNLHTLGIYSTYPLERGDAVELPSLRRLIITTPAAIYNLFDGCLTRYGPQITTLELEKDSRFLRHDFVASLLGYCPNTTDLYIPVFTTKPVCRNTSETNLKYFAVRHMADDYEGPLWRTQLTGHIEGLCDQGTRFTMLRRIIFSGTEWRHTIKRSWFSELLRLASSRGVELVCDDRQLQNRLFVTIGGRD